MEAKELLNEGLKRQYRVVIPAEELTRRLDARLSEMARTARLPGFRPGKVPVAHLKRLYGRQMMGEIVDEAIRDSVERVLSDNSLRAAYQPQIALEDESGEKVEAVLSGEADLAYTMTFEITPEVEVKDFSGLELTRYRVKVPDSDVDEAVANIAEQFRDYEDKGAGATAAEGDRLTISFVGRIDGEEFEGGTAEDVPLVIGSGQFIPGFEEQLIGARAGEERTVTVTFPEQYGVEKLAGREAEFTVQVKSVEAPVEQAIDDAFAQKIGFENLEALRQRVREQAEGELAQMAHTQLKRDVLDALDEQYDFAVPQRLVDSEFEQIWHTLEHEMK
ncbi:MAG TPA: trigger factor, partial [Rhodospirillales bacterium]|nr:trigger factor [Rhodospirillales bacterium]